MLRLEIYSRVNEMVAASSDIDSKRARPIFMIISMALSEFERTLLSTNVAVLVRPQTSAAIDGLELTKVSTAIADC
jgi:hypothetical protein